MCAPLGKEKTQIDFRAVSRARTWLDHGDTGALVGEDLTRPVHVERDPARERDGVLELARVPGRGALVGGEISGSESYRRAGPRKLLRTHPPPRRVVPRVPAASPEYKLG